MRRIVQGHGFRSWEAFANTGDFGFSDPARIVFHCLSDPAARARAVEIEGNKSDAEKAVVSLPEEELRRLLEEAEVLD